MIASALERQHVFLCSRNGRFVVEFRPRAVVLLHPRHVVTAVSAATFVRQHRDEVEEAGESSALERVDDFHRRRLARRRRFARRRRRRGAVRRCVALAARGSADVF